jgi:hypothetical protein
VVAGDQAVLYSVVVLVGGEGLRVAASRRSFRVQGEWVVFALGAAKEV